MRQKKELIPFLIAVLLGILLFIASFFSFDGTPRFSDTVYYLSLYVKDALFAKSLLLSVFLPLVCALVPCAIITVLFLKIKAGRKLYYFLTSAFSLTASFAFFIASGGRFLLLTVALSVIISAVTVFLCWLFEPVTLKKRFYENR